MAPPGSTKRKRPDRQYSQEDGPNRPSPHRPESLPLAQYGSHQNARGGGRGRGARRGPSHSHAHSTTTAKPVVSADIAQSQATVSQNIDSSTAAPELPSDPRRSVQPSSLPADDRLEVPPTSYTYDYITEEVVQTTGDEWKTTLVASMAHNDAMEVTMFIQELVRSGLDARIQPEVAGSAVADLIKQEREDALDIQAIFLDVISLLDEKEHKRRKLYNIVAATGIDPWDIRHELDVSLLQSLQLVRSTFNQMRTRKTTNILYRQANFNLLREESEGYAKLITNFYNASQDASYEGADPQVGKEAFKRVMALVGAFDLDVGRVLDVIIDISANTLVKAYRFFLKFYRYSSWWPENGILDDIAWIQEDLDGIPGWALPDSGKWQYDDEDKAVMQAKRQARDEQFWPRVAQKGMAAFFEIGARRITDFEAALPLLEQQVQPETDAKGREVNADKRNRINDSRKYMLETKTLPPPGNSDAAQLLGFKLRFYASQIRDKSDVLPENLIYLAALLIKVGFISLHDLYPHLYPLDENMEQEKARLEKEKEDKERSDRPGGGMNALASAAALTDDNLPAVRTLRSDNKSGGATPKAENKEDAPEDELPAPLNQKLILLKALLAIGALPEALFILGRFPWLVEVDISLPPYLLRIVRQMLSKLTSSVRPMADDDTQATKMQLADTVIASDGTIKLQARPRTRIRKWLGLESVDSGDGFAERHYYTDWDENIPVCQTVDDFFVLCDTFINLLGVKIGLDNIILSTMIRLARQDLQASEANKARWLELIRRLILPALTMTKHNPGLTQEVYDLLSVFGVTTRYGLYEEWYFGKTSRSPDIKNAFNKNRAEVKDVLRRITNESGKKMARALGKVTYSSPGIVMTTFINQLESYSNMIPGLVESVRYFTPFAWDILTWVLIRSFSGQGRDRIQADGMLTSPWLQALSQFAASLFTRYSSIDPSPVLQYIAFELRNGDSTDLELIDQVVSEMAGIKSDMNFNDTQILAMGGGEALQSVIVQQLSDTRHLRKSSAKRLMKALSDPGITAQLLISIAQERQMYAHRAAASNMPLKVLGNNLDKIQQVFAQYLEMLRADMTASEFRVQIPDIFSLIRDFGVEPGIAFSIYRIYIARLMAQSDYIRRKKTKHGSDDDSSAVEMTEADEQDYLSVASIMPDSKDQTTWYPFLPEYAQQLAGVTGDLDQHVSMLFYTVFWSFASEHVNAPLTIYEDEMKKINSQLDIATKDRSSTSATAVKEKERKCAALRDTLSKLRSEMSSRVSIFGDTKKWFAARKKDWFPVSTPDEVEQRHLYLLQECFLPRAMLSSIDAQYCFSIIKTLHSVATSGFSILALLDQLMRANLLSSIIFQSTAREAENLGHFLCEVLKLLSAWHADKTTYEKEAHGSRRNLVGFATRVDADGTPLEQLEYEEFRRKLFNWHNAITEALKACFQSTEYMQIRNGIVLLKAISTVYPAVKFHGKVMQSQLKILASSDPRDDLKLAALSLQGPLKVRESKWIIIQDFKLSNGEDTKITEEGEAQDGTKLDASAPEFKPESSTHEGRTGAEDGEIEDEKAEPAKEGSGDNEKPAAVTDVVEKQKPVIAENKQETVKTEGNVPPPQPAPPSRPLTLPSKVASKPASRTPSTNPPAGDRNVTRSDDKYGRLDRPSEARQSIAQDVPRHSSDRDYASRNPGRLPRQSERSPARAPSTSTQPSRNEDRRQPEPRQDSAVRGRPASSATPGPTPHPDRVAHIQPDGMRPGSASTRPAQQAAEMSSVVSQPSINPARAALINDGDRANDRSEHKTNGNARETRTEAAPTGPKAGRAAGSRDLFDGSGSRNGAQDQSRGRLSRVEGGHNQAHSGESSYGRLNGGPDGIAARTSERPTTNGPPDSSAGRGPQRGRNTEADRPATAIAPQANPASDSGPAVHPSRLANLGVDTAVAQSARGPASSPSVPSGPRGLNRPPPGTPTGPSPTNSTPTGPGSGHDRQRRSERTRGGSQSQDMSVSNNQGIQFRGAASQVNGPASSNTSAEQPRALASSMDAPSRPNGTAFSGDRVDRGRAEMMQRAQVNERGDIGRSDQQRSSRPSSRERYGPNGNARQAETHDGRFDRSRDGPSYNAGPPRRPGPPSAPGSFAAPPPDWNTRGNDFRGPPRRHDGGAGRGHIPSPASDIEGRKRRHEEGSEPPFDNMKRRRSNR